MIEHVLLAYGVSANASITIHGHGLINNTWKINDGSNSFILQKINDRIFKNPQFISENIHAVSSFISKNYPHYFFLTPCKTIAGKDLFYKENSWYRVFPFVQNSHAIDVAVNANQTFEAARMFGGFTKKLASFPADKLKVTLPDFHNLSLRHNEFLTAINSGNKERISEAKELIHFLQNHKNIVDEFEKIKSSNSFKLRVTHHDTKINNVLFNNDEKGICVIDLDTLMPGYFISDVGDMIRTYVSPVNEEEKDFSKIKFREDYFIALAKGYLSEMNDELSKEELQHFVYAGKFMIYMQALRFLTDYLNNDIYYGSSYTNQNLIRAGNQIQLLKLLIEKEKDLSVKVLNIFEKI